MTEHDLTALEKDFATEMFNVGMNRAAYALSQLTAEPVEIDIPTITISSFEDVAQRYPQGDVCVVAQPIKGTFDATALLIFSDKESFDVVEKILGSELSPETLHEIGEDALKEVGNIVLNACIGSMANWLGLKLEVGLPEYFEGSIRSLFLKMGYAGDTVALDIKISIRLTRGQNEGVITFILGPVSLGQFKSLLAAELADICAQTSVVGRA